MEQTTARNAGFDSRETRPDAYSFDYVTVEANEKMALETVDCYEALGWQIVQREGGLGLKAALTFKRNRKIANKNELNKIQHKMDDALKAVNGYEAQKTTKAFAAAMGIGIPGTLAFGGGMSLCIAVGGTAAIIGGIALGLAGLGICGLGYLAYQKINKKKTTAMNILIDKKREEISGFCDEASKYRA